MPEYLAPGVYIEEVPSGNKPIEGVSTSTAGVVGVTQRGPTNTPTLVTSFPAFTRRFGGYLNHRVFTEGRDSLPYAAEGFFTNGGQRLYVTRIVGTNAAFAEVDLFGTPAANQANTELIESVAAGDQLIRIGNGANIAQDSIILLQDGPRSEYVTAAAAPVTSGLRIWGGAQFEHLAGVEITPQELTNPEAIDIDAAAAGTTLTAGITTIPLTLPGGLVLAPGNVLQIRDTDDADLTEYVILSNDAPVEFTTGLLFDHNVATTVVERVTLGNAPGSSTENTTDDLNIGGSIINAPVPTGAAEGGIISIRGAGHALREFRRIQNVISDLTLVAANAVTEIHNLGIPVILQNPLLRVHARYEGQWGNDVRIRVEASNLLVTQVGPGGANAGEAVPVTTTFGIYVGSVVEINGTRQRVTGVDRGDNLISFTGGVTNPVNEGDTVSTIEFNLIVERIEDDRVVEDEFFEFLSMDSEHPQFALQVVGRFDRNSGEAEATGASELIRLSDLTVENDGVTDVAGAADLRLSIPTDRVSRMLEDGTDDLTNITDAAYIGQGNVDPDLRTGLQALENREDISIIAIPGRTSQDVQNAMIAHCAKMRYRFAVLDSAANAGLDAVQTQRQLYDTTYAALYYPWVTIGDRFGRPDDVLHIPPSGHILGIYARTDVERGVHKAPANSVIQGIRELQVRLTKGEQDILNPKHINCLRDFRLDNRGLRVWGARTISSDPEWKYVNVRRLFLFIERSIEIGTQFAVFEPNAEPLWATIRRSVSNFLVAVWRDGALEGTSEEEAFFVKVDRTTMTQNDIDNGRLIILVGIAPVKPAEFVIFRISQKTRDATA